MISIDDVGEVMQLMSITDPIFVGEVMQLLSITDPIFVSGGKKKRDVIVGDRTGTAKVTLWEDSLHQNEGKLCGMRIHLQKVSVYVS